MCLVKVEPVEHISRVSVPDGDATVAVPCGEAKRAAVVVIVSSRDGMLGGAADGGDEGEVRVVKNLMYLLCALSGS